jgi:hypothetical protein
MEDQESSRDPLEEIISLLSMWVERNAGKLFLGGLLLLLVAAVLLQTMIPAPIIE